MLSRRHLYCSLLGGLLTCLGCTESRDERLASAQPARVLDDTDTMQDFGEFVVHFNALMTAQLDPTIAREYNIVRSRSRALINISVQTKADTGETTPVRAAVDVIALDTSGQIRPLPVREVREGAAIYYLAETSVTDAETLTFTVEATPRGVREPLSLRFRRSFFVD